MSESTNARTEFKRVKPGLNLVEIRRGEGGEGGRINNLKKGKINETCGKKFSTFHARYELQSAVIARARKKIKLKKSAIKKKTLDFVLTRFS